MGQNWENIKSLVLGHINAVNSGKNIQDKYDADEAVKLLTAEEDAFCKSFDDVKYNILPPVRLVSGSEQIYYSKGGKRSFLPNKRNVLLTRLNSFDNYNTEESRKLRDYIIAIEFNIREDSSRQSGLAPSTIISAIDTNPIRNGIIRINGSAGSNKKSVVSFVLIKIADDNAPKKITLDNLYNYLISTNSMLLSDVTYQVVVGAQAVRNVKNTKSRNVLYCGAPGTGKSHAVSEAGRELAGENICRVTFYEDYSYENFVGCYKPVSEYDDSKNAEVISYKFCPGPFTDMYVNAKKNPDRNYCLIIEEINRAKAASVFGDIFQLLDRDKDGKSEYSITPDTELRKHLKKMQIDDDTMCLPSNFYIYATMNSADQGVHPLDSAFKRRWDFIYMDLNAPRKFNGFIMLRVNNEHIRIRWNDLRGLINKKILDAEFDEDKCLGEWFFKPAELAQTEAYLEADPADRLWLPNPMADKLYAYLRQDVFRHNPDVMFKEGSRSMSALRAGVANKNMEDVLEISADDLQKIIADTKDKMVISILTTDGVEEIGWKLLREHYGQASEEWYDAFYEYDRVFTPEDIGMKGDKFPAEEIGNLKKMSENGGAGNE